jgi:hypothetical protein
VRTEGNRLQRGHGCRGISHAAGQHISDPAQQPSTVDFSLSLIDLMAIADEVDSQLKQAMIGYVGSSQMAETLA